MMKTDEGRKRKQKLGVCFGKDIAKVQFTSMRKDSEEVRMMSSETSSRDTEIVRCCSRSDNDEHHCST